jgi:hypothetical protein
MFSNFRGRASTAKREPTAQWSIGIYSGQSPVELGPPGDIRLPVLSHQDVTDVPAAFVADPFMIRANEKWHMFFEVMNKDSEKGEIGLAQSDDGLKWTYKQVVLAEPYHLSYPYVFEWMDEYYMVPESYMAGSVRLYKAVSFPTRWTFAGTLLAGPYLVDPSILRYGDRWWLFVDASPAAEHDTLRLFWAENLLDAWQEHPQSPIISGNSHMARPAGRLIELNGTPLRYTQDCHPVYGGQVYALQITDLTTRSYNERIIGTKPILTGSGKGWNASGMHQIDAHPTEDGDWIACVDGFHWE